MTPTDTERAPNETDEQRLARVVFAQRCKNFCPPEYRGPWRDWHRGHGCDLDDGKPRSANAVAEINSLRRLPPPPNGGE